MDAIPHFGVFSQFLSQEEIFGRPGGSSLFSSASALCVTCTVLFT
jgi:hypothetical protein